MFPSVESALIDIPVMGEQLKAIVSLRSWKSLRIG